MKVSTSVETHGVKSTLVVEVPFAALRNFLGDDLAPSYRENIELPASDPFFQAVKLPDQARELLTQCHEELCQSLEFASLEVIREHVKELRSAQAKGETAPNRGSAQPDAEVPEPASRKDVVADVFKVLGGQASVGRIAGVSQQAAGYWLKRGVIPAEKVLVIEWALNDKGSSISRYDIRPDVYCDHAIEHGGGDVV